MEAANFFEKSFEAPGTIEGIIELFGGKRPLAEAMAQARGTKVNSQMRNLQRYTTGATETRVPKELRQVLQAVGKEKAQEATGERIKRDGITVTRYRGDFSYDGRKPDHRENRMIQAPVYIPGELLGRFVDELRDGSLVKATELFNEAYFVEYGAGSNLEMHNVTQLQFKIGR